MGIKENKAASFWRFALIVTALFVLFLFLMRDGLVDWVRAGIAVREQQERIGNLEEEIEKLDARTDALENNRDSLEKFAREQYGFTAPGEDVYVVR